ncbi:MAG: electron transfer flavoprotein subunit beta/FixA family protein [Candidatus Limnocylindria bacterium]
MKIVVCIKQVPATGADKRYTDEMRLDRVGVEAIINPLDEYAIEQALRLLDAGTADSVTYLSMGPDQASEALRRALAMGGHDAVLITDTALAGADEWTTAKVLAAALDKLAPDVALMGMASDDARGSLVPGAVAAMRDVPLLSYGSELTLADGEARVRRLSATGFDWIAAPLPVVATVTDQVGEPRYASLKGIMAAKRKPLETWSLSDLDLSPDSLHGAALTMVTATRAPEEKPPTERIENVPAPEAAVKIADWLEQRKLI